MKPDNTPVPGFLHPDDDPTAGPLRLRGGADVAALVPYLLGFHPHDSVVALLCSDGRLFVTARIPLEMAEHPLAFDDQLRRLAGRVDCPQWIFAGYGEDRERVAAALRLASDLVGPDSVVDAIHVEKDRYWSVVCSNPACCPPEGVRYDPTASPAALHAVVAGLQAVDSRERLLDRIRPPRGWTARAARLRLDNAHDLIRQHGLAQTADQFELLLAQGLADAAGLAADELSLLSACASYGLLRDAAYPQLSRSNAEQHVRLWQAVVRATARDDQGPALAMLGLACWVAGDGAMQMICWERASRLVPELSLVHILDDINRQAVPPGMWDQLLVDMFGGEDDEWETDADRYDPEDVDRPGEWNPEDDGQGVERSVTDGDGWDPEDVEQLGEVGPED